jgi:hypothetical protein
LCESEEEARELSKTLPDKGQWPCLFTASDTTGEKDFEEFFTDQEKLDLDRFDNLGIIKNRFQCDESKLIHFTNTTKKMKADKKWTKDQIVALFFDMIPDFGHKETGKYLDGKM